MLTIFFTIIFIAELIVASRIISFIADADKAVCTINQKVLEFQPVMQTNIRKAKSVISLILSSLDYFVTFIAEKKDDCTNALKKNILTSVLFLVLKIPGKRIFTIVDILLTLKNLVKQFKK